MRSGERYSGLEEYEIEVAGQPAPTLRMDYRGATAVYRVHRSHLVHGGSSWVVQRNAPTDQFDEWAESFDRVVGSFAFIDLSEEGRAEQRLAELSARCGSEVDWAADWEEAAERAREGDRPVLVAAWLLASFTGAQTARHGIFCDPDVIELVNERFVPLWYERGMTGAFVEKYGLSRTAFGKALIAVTADGETIFQTHELDSPTVAHQFLRERLARHPEYGGTPVAEDLPAIERARRHAGRGELDRAEALLEGDRSAPAHRLRAKILRLRRDGEGALAALAAAHEAAPATESSLLVEEARVRLHLGQGDQARRRLERVLGEGVVKAEASEAALLLSFLDVAEGESGSARERWRSLVEEDPESRSAWRAAAALQADAAGGFYPPLFRWPEEEAIAEVLAPRDPAPVAATRADEVLEEAVEWLLAAQQADGSWVSPTEVLGEDGHGPEPFVDSIAALGGLAVLSQRESEGCEEAAREALGFVLASVASRERIPPFTMVMDYTPWSDCYMLAFLAEARGAGLADADTFSPAVASLLRDLRSRQQRGGGWAYLVTDQVREGAPPSHSLSFLTAAVVRSLCRVRDAGFDVPEEMLDDAASCLERMRNADGGFEYRLTHAREDAARDTPIAGAAGRGAVCELALHCAGRGSAERLREAISGFLAHSDLYVAETGKALAHAGPYIIGCHYLLFDYQGAAEALTLLDPDPATAFRLRELILTGRLADGSFIDNPVVGRAYATSMAVLALGDLRGR